MATLLLRLQGPMQSWGTTSRFDERDTQLEPSKSGVLGLVCAALGRDRCDPIDDLVSLRIGVRVDREGVAMRDYQTATGVVNSDGKVKLDRTVISPRYYLSDAAFLVGLEGADVTLLERIQVALRAPVWPLALGRKSFVPSMPVALPDGILPVGVAEALRSWPALVRWPSGASIRLALEDSQEGSVRLDQPVGPFALRQFGPRFIKQEMMYVPDPIDA